MSESHSSARRVADLIERLARLLRAPRQGASGLNPAQWAALAYLARANRYSRTPGALAEFLGATKGTVSQTALALVRKGLVTREEDAGDRRMVRLGLTARGRARLAQDPAAELLSTLPATGLGPLESELAGLLAALQRANGGRAFGQCRTCRFFRADGARGERGGPHRCGLTGEPLAAFESLQICAEHEPAAA